MLFIDSLGNRHKHFWGFFVGGIFLWADTILITMYLAASKTTVQYLHVLLYADQMFQKGLTEIFHCQSSGYYKTLLDLFKRSPELLKEVRPNQPLSYYKLWKQKRHGRKNHGHAAPATDAWTPSAVGALGDLEVEEG